MPVNVASLLHTNVNAERAIGVDASGISSCESTIVSSDGIHCLPTDGLRFSAFWWRTRAERLSKVVREIARADVIHWYQRASVLPHEMDIRLVAALRKPAVVELIGSEVRIPEVEFEDNPFYKRAWAGGYEYAEAESQELSRATQMRFAKYGFVPLFIPGTLQYWQRDLLPVAHLLERGLMLGQFEYTAGRNGTKPLVVHAPSARAAKGTEAVLGAVESLKHHCDFDFMLLEGMTRARALEVVRECDIFLDQFVLGDYGMAAIEAMGFGKPVVCYIKPSISALYPKPLPIVNATQDTLAATLGHLIADRDARIRAGRASRRYVEEYHDAVKWAHVRLNLYESLCNSRLDMGRMLPSARLGSNVESQGLRVTLPGHVAP